LTYVLNKMILRSLSQRYRTANCVILDLQYPVKTKLTEEPKVSFQVPIIEAIVLVGTYFLLFSTPSSELEPTYIPRRTSSSSEISIENKQDIPKRSTNPTQNSRSTNQKNPSPPSKMAMTWRVIDTYSADGKQYALFGTDNLSNPYKGDTNINEVHSLLCIKKSDLPPPNGIPSPIETQGGALRDSWSGGRTIALPNIKANELTSQAIADQKCLQEGQKIGEDGFRMAEFHDGDRSGGSPGWSFWAEDFSGAGLDGSNTRYWVQIKDQLANPWN